MCLQQSNLFLEAARSVQLCSCDRKLQPDELWILSLFRWGRCGHGPYGGALRNKMAVKEAQLV